MPALWSAPPLTAVGWTALALLGTVQLGVADLLYSHALKHVTALEAVLIPIIEPILNPIWVMLVVGEKPSPLALAGGALVVGAVAVRVAGATRTEPACLNPRKDLNKRT